MSKHRKNKGSSKGKKRRINVITSSLAQHTRVGNKLRPPLAQIPGMTLSSWKDDHMPEMLWAVLLCETFDRKTYLACFRELISLCAKWFRRTPKEGEESKVQNGLPRSHDGGMDFDCIVDQTTLAEVQDEQFQAFIEVPLRHPLGFAALRPLLLLESLPGRERWKAALGVDPFDADWETMAHAIAAVLDHQSERSTDIRWFKLMVPLIAGRIHYPYGMEERIEELCKFPDKGDMRHVRPFIRAAEMNLRRNPPALWIERFWAELQAKTKCIDPSQESEYCVTPSSIEGRTFYLVREAVIGRFLEHMNERRIDARLDGAFGLVLYALAIVEEVGFHNLQRSITGRFALRAAVEANITLRYLILRDDDKLWRSYRVYGAGQAKLAFLKIQEAEGDLPAFIDETSLISIANEDTWQEHLDIDVGHWANSNLRKLAMECGAKDLYDKYYNWSSTFLHSHWGAIRDTNFITCHNPLHRLHRIPRHLHRMVSAVDTDLVDLTNDMLNRLDQLYPGSEPLPRLRLTTSSSPENGRGQGEEREI